MKRYTKHLLLALTALFISLSTWADGNYQRGDVNGSGTVDLTDVSDLLSMLMGTKTKADITTKGDGLADVNMDQKVSIADLATLIQILDGKYSETQHNYVDLGLTSGTKWATMNVGATNEGAVGDLIAWGELFAKDNYMTSTYFDPSYTTLTSGSNIIGTKHDAATARWGADWQMPTRAQLQELKDECTWTCTTQNSIKGFKVTGPNGNSIFLPMSGYAHDTAISLVGSYGFYWDGSNMSGSSMAEGLAFTDGSQGIFRSYYNRINGRSIRPVKAN